MRTAYSFGPADFQFSLSDNGVNGIQSYQDMNVLVQDIEVARNNWRGWADEHKGFDTVDKWPKGEISRFGEASSSTILVRRVARWRQPSYLVDNVFSARNKMRGAYFELNPGPITIRDSKLCENAFEGIANARTDNLTVTNNQISTTSFGRSPETGFPTLEPDQLANGATYTRVRRQHDAHQ